MSIPPSGERTGFPSRIQLFAGKGGVGKTTCSAALACRLSALGRETFLLTSDLAPSLSDILERPIGDSVVSLWEGLSAAEFGQDAVARRWKAHFGPDFQEILSHFLDIESLDRESRVQLLDYIGTAPSLREETLLDLIVEEAGEGRFERVVWDTAPAGETLNLLDMPRTLRNHLRAGTRFFQALDGLGHRLGGRRAVSAIMDSWVARSERISRFLQERAAVVMVANPERMVVRQTERILATLRGYGIRVAGMVVNRVREGSGGEARSRLLQLGEGMPVVELPWNQEEIRGRPVLEAMGKELMESLTLD